MYNCFNALCLIDMTDGSLYQIEDRPLPGITSFNVVSDTGYITYFPNGARYLLNLDDMELISLPESFVTDFLGRKRLGVPFNLSLEQLYVPGVGNGTRWPGQLWTMQLSDTRPDFSLRLTYKSDAIPAISSGYPYFTMFNGDIWAEVRGQPGRIKSSAAMLSGDNPDYVKISTDIDGAGNISSANSKILCGESCTDYVSKNSQISITATPAPRHYFTGWQGNCNSESRFCSIAANKNQHLRAIFKPMLFDITFEQLGRGQVDFTVTNMTADSQNVVLTLKPQRGYRPQPDMAGSCPAGYWLDEHRYVIPSISENCSISIVFHRLPAYRSKIWRWLVGEN